jgi:hypothetical protein
MMIRNNGMKCSWFLPLIFALLGQALFSQAPGEETISVDLGFSLTGQSIYKMLEGQPDHDSFFETTRLGVRYTSPLFHLVLDGSLIGDNTYDGSDEQEYLKGRYFFMNAGYADLFLGPFTVRTGRAAHSDQVQSPYSLYISSMELPALQVNVRYDGDLFFYENRWISLNVNSRNIYTGTEALNDGDGVRWVDRGMNYKVMGINAGDWRFGFQDTMVYLGQEFRAEYFLSPIPMYLTQIILSNPGRPWGEWGNTKSMMGFFAEKESDNDYRLAQLLIDDVNASVLPWIEGGNLTKVAWGIGGRRKTSLGTFGFYHAGATKYTFQATYAKSTYTSLDMNPGDVEVYYSYLPYEYTYYPASTYMLKSGDEMPLHYQDNYIGYKYGENNIAFLVDWQKRLFAGDRREMELYANLEWVASGAKSPNNPWHEHHSTAVTDKPAQLLDGTVEHIVRSTVRLAKPLGDFTLGLDLTLGYIFNAMELRQPEALDEAHIFYPTAGNHRPLVIATIGGQWSYSAGSAGKGRNQ